MKKSGASKVKLTVIVGYAMVVIVMVIGLIALYNNLVDFSNKRIKSEDLSELIIVGNTLSLLYEVESEQNLFTSESAQNYFNKYDSIFPEIENNLNEMKLLTSDSLRVTNLDTIKQLIIRKKDNLLHIAGLLDSINQAPQIISSLESSFIPSELNREISDYLEKNNISRPEVAQSDTSVVIGDRKGFLDRVRNVFVANADSTIVIENRSVVSDDELKLIVDTIINKVRYSERLDLTRQREFQLVLLKRQEVMSHTNRLLTSRIDNLLKEIEQEEIRKSIELINERELTLSKSQNTMQLVSILGILIAMLFAILFLVDINRSQRYRKQLEKSNKRISDLLASREKLMLTISHDIKSPTGSILGFIELLKDDNSKSEEYLSSMKSSADHVLQLVSVLLNYHKLDSGTWQLNETNFNLNILVTDTASSFEPMALSKSIEYIVENAIPENQYNYGDQYVLRQIFGNLISNAIKYTLEGEVKVTAKVDTLNNEEKLIFSVKDTGIGIDLTDHDDVFKEFKQVGDISEIGQVDGIGLGLAITKAFVDELEGEIKIISEKNKGSEFIVEIPLKMKHNSVSNLSPVANEGKAPEDISLLVVDDDPIQLMMASEMISKLNINCITESNPDRVISLVDSKLFDILFIDINLAGSTGFELISRINKLENNINKNTPIVALSARSDISNEKMRSSGFSDFLNKPFTSDQLKDMICRYVKVYSCSDNKINEVANKTENVAGVSALIDFVKDDKVVSNKILKSFVDETTHNCNILSDSFKSGDITTSAQISHKLLPLIRVVGNGEVIGIMELLEKGNSLNTADEIFLIDSIKRYVEEAEVLLKTLV